MVDFDAAFGARDRGEGEAEVVCDNLHRKSLRESLWVRVVDWSDGLRVGEDSVDFPCDESFEASNNVSGSFPLGFSACCVFFGPGIGLEADHGDPPERVVGLTVPAPVQSVAAVFPRRCFDRRDAAERGKG